MSSPIQPVIPPTPPAKQPVGTHNGNALPSTYTIPELGGRGFRRGMMLGANFGSALEALWANRMRSLLTALGIFIGVAAVITAFTLTQGASAAINDRITALGTNLIIIFPGEASRNGAFGAGGNAQSPQRSHANQLHTLPPL